jgi:cysteine-rich repeat protein
MMNQTVRPYFLALTTFALACTLPACAIELIDDIIDERGVTYCSETTQVLDTSTGSTGSSETGTTLADTTQSSTTGETSTGMSESTGISESTGMSESEGTISTTDPGPICGDGFVEGEETCDDMNDIPDDGCNNICARDSIVFITSQTYQGNVNGLAGADQRCRMLAAIADLPRFETYRAWLSSSTKSAGERLLHSRGRYVLVNGLVVAQDWDALVSGTLEHPINVDENSQTQAFRAWTSTLASGEAAPGADFCDDWTGVLDFDGGTGLPGATDVTWSFFENVPCDVELRLYCLEQ